jgi:hypothetical protein
MPAAGICAALDAADVLAAAEPLAVAAVRPPAVARTAKPIPAMMILGCRIVSPRGFRLS